MTISFTGDARSYFESASEQTQADSVGLLGFLSRGFFISRFRELETRIWSAMLKPNETVQSQFALRKEYLLIGNGYPKDFHQRTFLAEAPGDLTYRIDRKVRFVYSPAPLLRAACAAWAEEKRISIIPIGPEDLAQADASSDPTQVLFSLLTRSIWRRDVFDDSEPVRDPTEFYGRDRDQQEILGAPDLSGTIKWWPDGVSSQEFETA